MFLAVFESSTYVYISDPIKRLHVMMADEQESLRVVLRADTNQYANHTKVIGFKVSQSVNQSINQSINQSCDMIDIRRHIYKHKPTNISIIYM